MNNWLLNLFIGILAIIMGFVAFAYPAAATLSVELVTGWSFIILGILAIIASFTDNASNGRVWTILIGILMIIAGWVLVRNPLAGILALTMAFGIFAIASGIVKFFTGWKIVDTSLKWLTIISGVASFILGFMIMGAPGISLGILLGAELIFDGIALIALAFARKKGGVNA